MAKTATPKPPTPTHTPPPPTPPHTPPPPPTPPPTPPTPTPPPTAVKRVTRGQSKKVVTRGLSKKVKAVNAKKREVTSDTDSFSEKGYAIPVGHFQPQIDSGEESITFDAALQAVEYLNAADCEKTFNDLKNESCSTQTTQTEGLKNESSSTQRIESGGAPKMVDASTQNPTECQGYSFGSTNKYIFERKIMWSTPRMPPTPPGYKVSSEDRGTNRDRALRLHGLLKQKRKEDPAGRYFISGADVVQVTTVEHAPVLNDDLADPEPDFWYGHIDTKWFDEELQEETLSEVSCC
jgi:hypothetical protein